MYQWADRTPRAESGFSDEEGAQRIGELVDGLGGGDHLAVGAVEDGRGAAAVVRRTVRARDNAGPLPGGAQLEEHRIARAGSEGVDKPEERFADESLRVIPDEQ
jgi:hypothetical protein